MEIKIRYTWRRKNGEIYQDEWTIKDISNHRMAKLSDIQDKLVATDLWTGFYDSEGNEVYGGDKVLIPSKRGEYTTLVSWDGTAWIIDPNKSKISDCRAIIVVNRGKIVGNVHINNQSQKS